MLQSEAGKKCFKKLNIINRRHLSCWPVVWIKPQNLNELVRLVIASAIKPNYNHSSVPSDHDDEKSKLYKSRLMVKDLTLPRPADKDSQRPSYHLFPVIRYLRIKAHRDPSTVAILASVSVKCGLLTAAALEMISLHLLELHCNFCHLSPPGTKAYSKQRCKARR